MWELRSETLKKTVFEEISMKKFTCELRNETGFPSNSNIFQVELVSFQDRKSWFTFDVELDEEPRSPTTFDFDSLTKSEHLGRCPRYVRQTKLFVCLQSWHETAISFTLLQVSKKEELLHGIKLEPVPAMSTTDRSCAEDRTNIPH